MANSQTALYISPENLPTLPPPCSYLIYINTEKIVVKSKKNAFPVLWIGIYYYLCTRFRSASLGSTREIEGSLNARSK